MSESDPFAQGLVDVTPRRAAAEGGEGERRRKAEREAALAAAPEDPTVRAAYFDYLGRLAGTRSGLLWAVLPELAAPLHFRAGTPDIGALAAAFRDHAYAIPELAATPRRIAVIGAYAGYEAVALARLHPDAQLLCAEPLADNLRLLALNTSAWRQIRVLPTAVWHSATRLAPVGRLQGDWAVRLTDEALDADRVIPAISLPELLARAGWTHADMVVCDAAGAEREIFSDPLASWLRHVDVVLVRIYDQLAPQAGAMVSACFQDGPWQRRQHGPFELYLRDPPLTALPPRPPELPLLRAEPGSAPLALQEVAPFGWAFFIFDGSSCQLHPNPPGGKPARAIFPLRLDGQARFTSGLAHAGQAGAAGVTFTARLCREDGAVLAEASATLASQESDRLTLALPDGLRGPAAMVLETAVAAGSAHNHMAWARWIDPKLS